MKFRLIERVLNEDIEYMKKYFPNIPDEQFQSLIELDPTYKPGSKNAGNYGRWILTLANKGKLDNIIHSIEYLGKNIIPYIRVLTNWLSEKSYTEYEFYTDGRIDTVKRQGIVGRTFPIENLTFTIYGVYPKVVPQWASMEENKKKIEKGKYINER